MLIFANPAPDPDAAPVPGRASPVLPAVVAAAVAGHIGLGELLGAAAGSANHAKNKIAGPLIPFSVLDFWDKTPRYAPAPCHIAGISGHYQDPGIQAEKGMILAAILFLQL